MELMLHAANTLSASDTLRLLSPPRLPPPPTPVDHLVPASFQAQCALSPDCVLGLGTFEDDQDGSLPLHTKPGQVGINKRGPRTDPNDKAVNRITLAMLTARFGMSQKKAAMDLSISQTTLKKCCRKHDISKWPFKFRMLSEPPTCGLVPFDKSERVQSDKYGYILKPAASPRTPATNEPMIKTTIDLPPVPQQNPTPFTIQRSGNSYTLSLRITVGTSDGPSQAALKLQNHCLETLSAIRAQARAFPEAHSTTIPQQ